MRVGKERDRVGKKTKSNKRINNKNDCIIYCRISSQKQSLDSQEEECKKFCIEKGYTVKETIREIKSARLFKNMTKLKECIYRNKNIDIIVLSIDRFMRNFSDTKNIITKLKQNNINIISINKGNENNTPVHLLISGSNDRGGDTVNEEFLDSIKLAQLESELISHRVKRGIDYKLSLGNYFGAPGYGYDTAFIEKDIDGSKINIRTKIVNKREMSIIECIVKVYMKSMTYYDITKTIDELYSTINPEMNINTLLFYNEFSYYNEKIITPLLISDIFNHCGIEKNEKIDKWNKRMISNIYKKFK